VPRVLGLLILLSLSTARDAKAESPSQRSIGFSNLVFRISGDDDIGIAQGEFRVHILEELRKQGLGAVGAESLVFGKDRGDEADLLLGGTVRELQCTEVPKKGAACRLGIEWELLDVRRDLVVYSALTRFAVHRFNLEKPAGVPTQLVLGALRSLVKRPAFRALLKRSTEQRVTEKAYPVAEYQACGAAARAMPLGAEAALDATVVVKTDTGFGSGFFLNNDGHVVTAAHVVADARMQVARRYIERATGTSISAQRWYATLLELWFRRFSDGGDPDLSGFEHVFVGEQQGSVVQGYHFWYKYWLDDGLAREIDQNLFPGLKDDRIQYLRSEASAGQNVFPHSVTIAYRWNAPDYDRKAVRPLVKKKGGFFVGCSVEGLMALGAVRAHLGAAAPKEAVIGGARYELAIYRSPDGKNIRTFYPIFRGPAPNVDGPERDDDPIVDDPTIPEVVSGAVRIVAALVNPEGDDAGREAVTVVNVGRDRVALSGWKLQDKAKQSHSLGETSLLPGHAVTVVLPPNTAQLSNQGGEIRLLDRAGKTVHAVSYSKAQASRQGETIVF
jgi:hypothetical protein